MNMSKYRISKKIVLVLAALSISCGSLADQTSSTASSGNLCSNDICNFPANVYVIELDEYGFDEYGYDENGLDENGYDKKGFDKEGLDRSGLTEEERVEYKTDGEPPRDILYKIKVDYVKEKSGTQPLLALLTGGITGTVFVGTSLIAGKFNEELMPVVVGAALFGDEKFDKEVVSYNSKLYSDAILNAMAIHCAVALVTCRGDLKHIAWCVPFKVITGTVGSLGASYITKTKIFNDVASDSLPYTNSLATSALIREGTRFLVKFNDVEHFVAGWVSDVVTGVTMDGIALATTNGD